MLLKNAYFNFLMAGFNVLTRNFLSQEYNNKIFLSKEPIFYIVFLMIYFVNREYDFVKTHQEYVVK